MLFNIVFIKDSGGGHLYCIIREDDYFNIFNKSFSIQESSYLQESLFDVNELGKKRCFTKTFRKDDLEVELLGTELTVEESIGLIKMHNLLVT